MWIDRSDPAHVSGNADIASRVRSTADDLDTTGKNEGAAVKGDAPNSSPARLDSTLQTERTMAYRAAVDAAYRQYRINRGDVRAETVEGETTSPVGSETSAATRNGAASTFDQPPATTSCGEGSIGNGGGAQPPAGDTPPDPEGDDPEGLNGGLGELVSVNAKDRAADLLAERIGGEASVRFANGPSNEFDALSPDYVAQAKPANFTLNQAFRNQAKTTFEVALQSGRTPYFQCMNFTPGLGFLSQPRRATLVDSTMWCVNCRSWPQIPTGTMPPSRSGI